MTDEPISPELATAAIHGYVEKLMADRAKDLQQQGKQPLDEEQTSALRQQFLETTARAAQEKPTFLRGLVNQSYQLRVAEKAGSAAQR